MTSQLTNLRPHPDRLLSALAPVASLLLVLPLLRVAARHDRHWQTATDAVVDHRIGAGLFLAAGVAAAAPVLATVAFGRGGRAVAAVVAVLVLGLAGLCEAVVSVAPQPWFTF